MSRKNSQELWQSRIKEYQASGQTLSAWCKANSVSRDALKYWLEKEEQAQCKAAGEKPARNQKGASPVFILAETDRSPENETSVINIRIGKACVEARAGVDIELLSAVLEAVVEAC